MNENDSISELNEYERIDKNEFRKIQSIDENEKEL